ncbi:predicted protein [Plenodomus lingam JN3]|uniref:Predicted protein n=1 Tax=Leptosphaeria maculans (strain JN3 / isolate v23.1.3 / race Av1-4-5-6-7-8) TaxID=985895 RepID=E4ZRF0_LEPMJ|nr:predicted protein [Plenodomus lingam JN3]CBX94144.1 predicted protein [Plenodomus lingam JN3]
MIFSKTLLSCLALAVGIAQALLRNRDCANCGLMRAIHQSIEPQVNIAMQAQ